MTTTRYAVHPDGVTGDGVDLDGALDGSSAFPLHELVEPDDAELAALGAALSLHPEALADARGGHLRPQLRAHPGCLAVVVKTPTLEESSDVELGEVVALVTPDAAALVSRSGGPLAREVRERLSRGADRPADVLRALLEVVTPDLDEVLYGLDEDVAEVEGRVFSTARGDSTQQIYKLKRELLELRRSVGPLVGVVERLAVEPSCPVPDELRDDFRGLRDRAARTADAVDHLDGLIGSVLDAQLAQIGVRQNEDQRRISAWAAIALVPTVVGGIYGMNFENMPELRWDYGYFAALTVVIVTCLSLYVGFRRNDWL